MKRCPYSEIIDFKSERKEYKRLCKSKSKQFAYYSDWEDHIKCLVSRIEDPKMIKNFKHYLINLEQISCVLPSVFLQIAIFAITVYISAEISNGESYIAILLSVVSACAIFVYITLKHDNLFYKDIINIIEEIETAM